MIRRNDIGIIIDYTIQRCWLANVGHYTFHELSCPQKPWISPLELSCTLLAKNKVRVAIHNGLCDVSFKKNIKHHLYDKWSFPSLPNTPKPSKTLVFEMFLLHIESLNPFISPSRPVISFAKVSKFGAGLPFCQHSGYRS